MLLETPHSHRSIMPPISSVRISTCTEALTQSLIRTLGAAVSKKGKNIPLICAFLTLGPSWNGQPAYLNFHMQALG